MADAPPHPYSYCFGRDRRGRDQMGMTRGVWESMFLNPNMNAGTQVFTALPSIMFPWYQPGYANNQVPMPWAVASAPFSVDDNGVAFPAGTMWIYIPSDLPTEGTVGVDVYPIYRASGIPAGSVGTGVITDNYSHATLSAFSVPYNGPNALVIVPFFPLPSAGWTVTTTWTAGSPIIEQTYESSASIDNGAFYAVPSTLPAGVTARNDTDQFRGATFQISHQNRKRLRAGPNTTYANMGISIGTPFGLDGGLGDRANSPFGPGLWVDGTPYWYYSYPTGALGPMAIGTQVVGVASGTFLGGIGPISGPPTFPVAGARSSLLGITYFTSGGNVPAAGDTVTILVQQDSTTIYSASATGPAAIAALAGTHVIVPTLNALGTTTTFTVTLGGSSTSTPIGGWSLSVGLSISPRCDIPFPFTVMGDGIAAPGGYVTSLLTAPTNGQPLTRLGAGVTSYTDTSAYNVAYLPATDGWWQVAVDSTQIAGIGMDPFGWLDGAQAAPGYAGRPFYACAPSAGTAVLSAWTPPSPTAIATGGTTMHVTEAMKYAFVVWRFLLQAVGK